MGAGVGAGGQGACTQFLVSNDSCRTQAIKEEDSSRMPEATPPPSCAHLPPLLLFHYTPHPPRSLILLGALTHPTLHMRTYIEASPLWVQEAVDCKYGGGKDCWGTISLGFNTGNRRDGAGRV